MKDNKVLAENIRNYIESGNDLFLTNDDYKRIIEALEEHAKTDNVIKSEKTKPKLDKIHVLTDHNILAICYIMQHKYNVKEAVYFCGNFLKILENDEAEINEMTKIFDEVDT